MNKKGFTLAEILAVIALIAVIMLLVTPNVLKLFTQAKKNLFHDETLSLYNNAYTTYIYNTAAGDYTKRFCKGKDATTKSLDVKDKKDLYYDITVNSYGQVISLKVANDEFGISLSNSSGIKKKDIKQDLITDAFDINCNGGVPIDPNPTDPLTCIITDTNRSCNIFPFNYGRSNQSL